MIYFLKFAKTFATGNSLLEVPDQLYSGVLITSLTWFLFLLLDLGPHSKYQDISPGFTKGKGAEKKPVFSMVSCQTGGRGVSEGSEKTILLF